MRNQEIYNQQQKKIKLERVREQIANEKFNQPLKKMFCINYRFARSY